MSPIQLDPAGLHSAGATVHIVPVVINVQPATQQSMVVGIKVIGVLTDLLPAAYHMSAGVQIVSCIVISGIVHPAVDCIGAIHKAEHKPHSVRDPVAVTEVAVAVKVMPYSVNIQMAGQHCFGVRIQIECAGIQIQPTSCGIAIRTDVIPGAVSRFLQPALGRKGSVGILILISNTIVMPGTGNHIAGGNLNDTAGIVFDPAGTGLTGSIDKCAVKSVVGAYSCDLKHRESGDHICIGSSRFRIVNIFRSIGNIQTRGRIFTAVVDFLHRAVRSIRKSAETI